MSANKDGNQAVGAGWNDIMTHVRENKTTGRQRMERSGNVATEHGFVTVYSFKEPGWTTPESTTLVFIHAGRQHTRRFQAFHDVKFLMTLAKRFAAEKVGVQ